MRPRVSFRRRGTRSRGATAVPRRTERIAHNPRRTPPREACVPGRFRRTGPDRSSQETHARRVARSHASRLRWVICATGSGHTCGRPCTDGDVSSFPACCRTSRVLLMGVRVAVSSWCLVRQRPQDDSMFDRSGGKGPRSTPGGMALYVPLTANVPALCLRAPRQPNLLWRRGNRVQSTASHDVGSGFRGHNASTANRPSG